MRFYKYFLIKKYAIKKSRECKLVIFSWQSPDSHWQTHPDAVVHSGGTHHIQQIREYSFYEGRRVFALLIVWFVQSESLERARHSRGERMRAQAEQASDLRRRNQALVHNVLPPHVARHFMGARHHHRDLYSQSYAEVGVLFASMPNFTGVLILPRINYLYWINWINL